MSEDVSNWRSAPRTEDSLRWQTGVVALNGFLENEANRNVLGQLSTSTVIDPEPTTFNDFQRTLTRYLPPEAVAFAYSINQP